MVIRKECDYETVIRININNFTFKGNNKIKEEYSLKNEEGEELTEKLKFIHIYLPNIRKKCYNKEKLKEAREKVIEEKLEITKELLNNNVQVDIIMKSTGLSKEEIESIK